MRRDGSLVLRERVTGGGATREEERTLALKALISAVRERQAGNAQQPVIISADKDVRYEAVLKVMDELQRANVQRVGLTVKPAGS
ncbi:biopolymer transport protein ExbD [compost metagenome]